MNIIYKKLSPYFTQNTACLRYKNQSTYTVQPNMSIRYLYCCTVHLVDSLNITLPTNALIVCHLL